MDGAIHTLPRFNDDNAAREARRREALLSCRQRDRQNRDADPQAQVAQKARLITDEASVYTLVGRDFAGVVNHKSGEYSRGHVTTNTVESSFAILKRGLYGTFHHFSEAHLQRYANEFGLRWRSCRAQAQRWQAPDLLADCLLIQAA